MALPLRRFFRLVKRMVLFILVSLFLLTLLFLIPGVQTRTARFLAQKVSDATQLDLGLGTFRYSFPNKFQFGKVWVKDEVGDTVIYVRKLKTTVAFISKDFGKLSFGNTTLIEPKLYLQTQLGDSMNGFERFLSSFSSKEPKKTNSPFQLTFNSILIEGMQFSKWWTDCDSCFSMHWKNGSLNAEKLFISGDSIGAKLNNISYENPSRFGLEHLEAEAYFTSRGSGLRNLIVQTPKNKISGTILLDYQSLNDFRDFAQKVNMNVSLQESTLDFGEIHTYFLSVPNLPSINTDLSFKGKLNDLEVESLHAEFLQTAVEIQGTISGIGETKDVLFDLEVSEIRTDGSSMQGLVSAFSEVKLPALLLNLDQLYIKGHYKGTPTHFDYSGAVNSDFGKVALDMHADISTQNAPTHLKGRFITTEFNLGNLSQLSYLNKLTANLFIDVSLGGKGEVEGFANGLIDRLDYNGYGYSGIRLDGGVKEDQFSGELSIKDPLLDFDFSGLAELNSDSGEYKFHAELAKLDLAGLGYVKDSVAVLSTKIDMNAKGVIPTNWNGEIRITETLYEEYYKLHFFDEIVLNTFQSDTGSTFSLNSDLVSANIRGKYSLADLPSFMKAYFDRYTGKPRADTSSVGDFIFDIGINNADLLTETFLPALKLEPGTQLKGSYLKKEDKLIGELVMGYLGYQEYEAENLHFQIGNYQNKPGARLRIAKLSNSKSSVDSIQLIVLPGVDSLRMRLSAMWVDTASYSFELNAAFTRPDSSSLVFSLKNSSINLPGHLIQGLKGGSVAFLNKSIELKEVNFLADGELIEIDGLISENPNDALDIRIAGLNLDILSPFLAQYKTRFKGVLSGKISASQLFGTPRIDSELSAPIFEFNDAKLGRLALKTDWEANSKEISIDASLMLGELKTLHLTGLINTKSTEADLSLELNRYRLSTINPYVEGIFENLRGFADGIILVKGQLAKPNIEGDIQLPGAAFTIPFLNTDYNLEGSPVLHISNHSIKLPNSILRDTRFGTKGSVNLNISHDHFTNLNLDLKIDANKLLCLNTNASHSSYYYGTAYGTGRIAVAGPLNKLKLTVDAKAEPGTIFTLLMGGPTEIGGSSFIEFKSKSADLIALLNEESNQLKKQNNGLEIEFNLDVTPDALLNVILDPQSGMMISARGEGRLQIGISNSGELSMVGNVGIDQGFYNFSFSNVITKKFTLIKGGSISWDGSPFEATIDIQALYQTRTSLGPILEDYKGVRTDIELYLLLTENLMNPNIDFRIKAPSATSDAQSKLANYMADNDRLTRQAFSILSLNAFMNDGLANNSGLFSPNAGTDLTYQLITDQLSNWLNSGVNFVDINVSYVGSEVPGELSEQLEVGLSKKVFNDRISINGEFDVPVGGQAQNQVLIGDVEVTYDITPDGRFKAKLFNRSNDQIQGQISTPYTQGLGIFYTTDFTDFDDLIHRVFGIKPKSPIADEP
jgi:hypothetical protein